MVGGRSRTLARPRHSIDGAVRLRGRDQDLPPRRVQRRLDRVLVGAGRGHREDIPGLAPSEILDGPRVRAPSRDYLLLRGPLGALSAITDGLGRQCPNLWWPQDRAWFLVTEIDFAWTYVAGPEALVTAIEQAQGIEAMRSGLDHPATIDSDERNR